MYYEARCPKIMQINNTGDFIVIWRDFTLRVQLRSCVIFMRAFVWVPDANENISRNDVRRYHWMCFSQINYSNNYNYKKPELAGENVTLSFTSVKTGTKKPFSYFQAMNPFKIHKTWKIYITWVLIFFFNVILIMRNNA